MMYIAYDTETELIAERKTLSLGTRKIKLAPFIPPRLVCVSECGAHGTRLYDARDGVGAVEAALEDSDTHLVFHNAAFDVAVLVAAGVADWKINKAVRERRIHDTMFMDILVGLAAGRYDMPNPPKFDCPRMEPRSLETLAQVYLKRALDKDPSVRLAYGQYLGVPPESMPPSFQEYAKQDAQATYDVWMRMTAGLDNRLLSEPLQTAASIALSDLDQTGTRIDRAEAQRLLPMFEKDMPALEGALVEAGLGREGVVGVVTDSMADMDEAACTFGEWVTEVDPGIWHPYTGHEQYNRCRVRIFKTKARVEVSFGVRSFHLNFNDIRSRLEELEKQLKVKAPRSDTGLLSMDADWWAERLPADAHDLHTWQKRQRLEKILNTYLRLYSQVDRVFANWNILAARSGRMSCSSPNLMNVPKRHHGIRSLFIPDEGKVFVVADYCAQEMYTLADTMAFMEIEGPLLKAIKDGVDLHKNTVRLMYGTPLDEVTKQQRQAAKAVNFGIPGGLGAAKFKEYAKQNYGVDMTLEEAKRMRQLFLRAFPDIAEFISRMQTDFNAGLVRYSGRGMHEWKQILGLDEHAWVRDVKLAMMSHESHGVRMVAHKAERGLRVELRSGRVRKGPTFTEGANTMFQGPASDVTKLAVIRAWLAGLEVKLVVHDELVTQCYPKDFKTTAELTECAMLAAFRELCPVTGQYAKVEVEGPLDRWGKATDKEGNVV